MLIDWFTVIAQIINFLILVALLKYFLYGRILAAMDQRQQQIDNRWQDAERAKQKAEQEGAEIQQRIRQMDDHREQLLVEVRDQVETHRHELVSKARSEVDEQRQRWADALREEETSFVHDLRKLAAQQVCAIARHALAELADEELEHRVVAIFLQKIRTFDDDQQCDLLSMTEDRSVTVESVFEISAATEADVTAALRERFGEPLDVKFQVSPDLACGIAISIGSHRIAWELGGYLDRLEQHILQTLEEEIDGSDPTHRFEPQQNLEPSVVTTSS